jgi:hypothetical protein
MSRLRLALSAIIVSAAILAACGGGGASNPTARPSGGATQSPAAGTSKPSESPDTYKDPGY